MNKMIDSPDKTGANNTHMTGRDETQPLLPIHMTEKKEDGYDIYPFHPLGNNQIHTGYPSLAAWMATQKLVLIDGYVGIYWHTVQASLAQQFNLLGLKVTWHYTAALQKDAASIQQLVAPFTGSEGDVWGTKCTLDITAFFDMEKLSSLPFDQTADLNIVIGTGATLTHPHAPLVYLDIPKNELQYRMRAGTANNFGSNRKDTATATYKRFYFVDWVVLNAYKQTLLHRITVMADTQWPENVSWMFSTDLLAGIDRISHSSFRVRPWFEPGAWGGQWMKEHIAGLDKSAVNYAWSFEMIVPENGVLLESSGNILEIPFEWLMYYRHEAILGRHATIFRYEFPIRFDFLDTFDGGNLSIQCHPTLDYIRKNFGETITQDETYYILDCKDDAVVYLGFQEGIDTGDLRTKLENSRDEGIPLEVDTYIQPHKARKHELFLIPNGTVHSAGANNMVLEISATPYIFTFKMYDWLRPGLDGKLRAINIGHAFNNLDFSRQGAAVSAQLISLPTISEQGKDWQLIHLPTHADHFYDVHRLEFDTTITIDTKGCCLVLMLVEGTSITVTVGNEPPVVYHYAETFVLPAAAGICSIKNNGEKRVKVIKAFLKEEHPVFSKITSIPISYAATQQ
ncbi:class I mannose-6-phosphate isomerase [Chitinophaga sp. MM2321]|uniref:class I mannose-6-phosphate isomerase n=1 Tax=Chitinophaga sp. MM2321 TaxID=3137178 RepID=UPI0032D59DB8